MRRGLWFAAGAGAGVYTMLRARRLAEAFTPEGLGDRWHALTLGVRMFRDEVAHGQAEAETELRERFGLVPHGLPELRTAQRTSSGPAGAVGRMGAVGSGNATATVGTRGSADDHTQEGTH